MILAGDGSVLRPSTVRSRQAARPRVPVGPTATAALEPAHGPLALDFRCQPPSDRRQWAPPAGGRLRQNTRTGQASAQMRATASTRATAGAGTAGQPPIACWPRTHRFWTNLSAPSPPQASSGPRQRGAGFLSGMGVGRGRRSPRKSSVITWPQTDVILKRAGWPAKDPLYSCTEQVPFSPLREDMLPAGGHRQARPDTASLRPGRPTVIGDRLRAGLHTSVFTPEFDSCLFQTLPRNAPDTP